MELSWYKLSRYLWIVYCSNHFIQPTFTSSHSVPAAMPGPTEYINCFLNFQHSTFNRENSLREVNPGSPDAMILVFWTLSFNPTFSLSSLTLFKRLFSSSSPSAIRVVSSAYLRLLIFLSSSLKARNFTSLPSFPFGNHGFVFCVCESVSAL